MNAIVPRQTIEDIVAHRDRAIALYSDAFDKISEATIDMSLVITDAASTPSRPQMKAIIASPLVKTSLQRPTAAGDSGRLTMDISVTLQQADLTHGMVSLMNLLQEGISDTQKEKKP